MRPKIVIAVLLAGFAGLVGIYFLKHLAAPAQQPAQPGQTAIASQAVAVAPPVSPIASNTPPAKSTATIAHVTTGVLQVTIPVPKVVADTNALAEEHEAYVDARIGKLQELQANDDAESLRAILAELTNADKEIRAAAVESTIQFGSRDAIPLLKDLAARTQDPDEKKDLLDAADFLALPTLTEIRAQNQTSK
jgi:HEAT repeat protein